MKTLKSLYQTYREVFWYLVCGAGTTVVNLICFWCCANLLRTPTAVSTAIAWLFSVIFAYITNRTFVFHSQNSGLAAILREMTAFFGARIFSGALDVALMVIFVDGLHLPEMWMKMAVNVLVTVCNFVASKWIVFREKPSKSTGEHAEKCSGKFAKREGSLPFEGRLWAPYFLLAIITAGLLLLPMGTGNFFGSLGDWYSQHVAVADSLRQTMLATGRLLPQWITLGAGSSTYDFAYYGLLRPDVLIACLMPEVEMKVIIAVYMIFCMIASVLLCYFWLKRDGRSCRTAFAGALLLAFSTSLYQAHHQIMFVNYLPFLLLALIGVDRLVSKGKIGLLSAGLLLVILHSFYYAPVCIVALGVYVLHRCFFGNFGKAPAMSGGGCGLVGTGRTEASENKRADRKWILVKFVGAVALAVGMGMALLLPTALDILSTSKDGGSFAGENLLPLDPGMENLLYSPYGCGMTLLCLYGLLISLKGKSRRFLAACLLIAMAVPAVSLVLNGFLYARGKILIPFVPLLAMVCADTLEELRENPRRHSVFALALCFVPAIFSEWKPLVLADGVILAVWVIWQRWGRKKREQALAGRRREWGCPVMLLVPLCVSIGVNISDASPFHEAFQKLGIPVRETYLAADDTKQQHISRDTVADFAADPDYRYEVLADTFMNVNVLPDGNVGRTSIYSSISNSDYGTFFYDIMGNAISYNNRVALAAGKNPLFQSFMGIRYLLVRHGNAPYGYEEKEVVGDYALTENENVRPICYGVTDLLSRDAFDRLDFWDGLEAISARTVVEDAGKGRDGDAADGSGADGSRTDGSGISGEDEEEFTGHFQRLDPREVFAPEDLERLLGSHEMEDAFSLRMQEAMRGKILGIRFTVERSDGREVVISMGGVKNKLSAKSAPYPNGNERFTFLLNGDGLEEAPERGGADGNVSGDVQPKGSAGKTIPQLWTTMTAGDYRITDLEVYALDKEYLERDDITPAHAVKTDGTERRQQETFLGSSGVYHGTIDMETDGYFVTSYPYRQGYEVLVDGRQVEPGKVNTCFVGFPVKEGEHEIEIRYQAPGFFAGCLISLVSGVLFLTVIYVSWRRSAWTEEVDRGVTCGESEGNGGDGHECDGHEGDGQEGDTYEKNEYGRDRRKTR